MRLIKIFTLFFVVVISCTNSSTQINTNAINSKIQSYDNGTRDSIYVSKNDEKIYIEFINSKGYNKKTIISKTKNNVILEIYKFYEDKIADVHYSDNGNIEKIHYYYGNNLDCVGQINFIFKLNSNGKIIEETYGVCTSELMENENGKLSIPKLIWNEITFSVENCLRKVDSREIGNIPKKLNEEK